MGINWQPEKNENMLSAKIKIINKDQWKIYLSMEKNTFLDKQKPREIIASRPNQ